MGHYIPSTEAQQQQMLRDIGLKDFKELYRDIPASMILDRGLDIPEGKSELEVCKAMTDLAGRNIFVELAEVREADFMQHLLLLGLGGRDVMSHFSPPGRRMPRMLLHRRALRSRLRPEP